jgi:hypothetical protein
MRTASPFSWFYFLAYFGGQGTEADQGVDQTGAEAAHRKPTREQKLIDANIANRDQKETPASAKSGKK